jgi:hypothetical protein
VLAFGCWNPARTITKRLLCRLDHEAPLDECAVIVEGMVSSRQDPFSPKALAVKCGKWLFGL